MDNFHGLEWGDTRVVRWADHWLKQVASESLVDLAIDGTLGDWRCLDFSVASVDDRWASVKRRHRTIRRLVLERCR
jgi:hypothetical protein